MTLPESLKEAIFNELQGKSLKGLGAASIDLSAIYRDKEKVRQGMNTASHREAYLTVRLPATYAAVHAVLEEVKSQFQGTVQSVLDLGAGPGTASWVASELFPDIQTMTLVERDNNLIALGQRLAQNSYFLPLKNASWQPGNITQLAMENTHDLVIMSYVIGELTEDELSQTIAAGWKAAKKCFVVIEPGTPRGYELIIKTRTFLIDSQAFLLAPCPHSLRCPMLDTSHWCHFKVRVERSSEHRKTKGALLGYEDEKYSYISATRQPMPLPPSRIVGHPQVHSGHLSLTLCTAEGIQERTYSRKQGDVYRAAKKATWGDPWIEN